MSDCNGATKQIMSGCLALKCTVCTQLIHVRYLIVMMQPQMHHSRLRHTAAAPQCFKLQPAEILLGKLLLDCCILGC